MEPLLHCNPLINLFKNSTKIWGWHVMSLNHFYAKTTLKHLGILSSTPSFQIWSSLHFCTTTYLNISLKLTPKFGDVSRSILFNFMQKPTGVLWKIWAKHPVLLSGSVWYFLLQPYFNLPFYPWLFFLLIDHSTKPLSPGDWTHWCIFGPCNNDL